MSRRRVGSIGGGNVRNTWDGTTPEERFFAGMIKDGIRRGDVEWFMEGSFVDHCELLGVDVEEIRRACLATIDAHVVGRGGANIIQWPYEPHEFQPCADGVGCWPDRSEEEAPLC